MFNILRAGSSTSDFELNCFGFIILRYLVRGRRVRFTVSRSLLNIKLFVPVNGVSLAPHAKLVDF